MPGVELGAGDVLDDHAQAFLAERLAVIIDVQVLGVDDDAAVALRHSALHMSPEIAVEYGLGDMILEMAGVGPFETHERIGEQADTPSVALDDVGGIRLWVRVAHEVGESGVIWVPSIGAQNVPNLPTNIYPGRTPCDTSSSITFRAVLPNARFAIVTTVIEAATCRNGKAPTMPAAPCAGIAGTIMRLVRRVIRLR